jgi:hypothetical protein
LGTKHSVQVPDHEHATSFRNLLGCLLKKHETEAIFEEWIVPEPTQTIGSILANECGLSWRNVGTPKRPEFETDEMLLLGWPEMPVAVCTYGPIQNQINREQFMLDKITQDMADRNSGLFICGLSHVHSITEKFIGRGFDTEGYQWQEPVSPLRLKSLLDDKARGQI